MRGRLLLLAASALTVFAADSALERANAKLDRLTGYEAKPGERIVFTPAEIDAWVRDGLPKVVPQGIREPHIELGVDTLSASAMVDFLKMEQARGKDLGWAVSKLIEGERPLKVSLRLSSGDGKCTVFVTRVELSGVAVEGAVLDFLIRTFYLPLDPDAKIGEPFDLDFDIDRIDIRPGGVRVTIKK
jgi:hypothetical protein